MATKTLTSKDYKEIGAKVLTKLRERSKYAITLGTDENGEDIELVLEHRRMPQNYYLKSATLPMMLSEAFANQFRGEDKEAFADRKELKDLTDEKPVSQKEQLIEMIDFGRQIILETVTSPVIIDPEKIKREPDYEKGEMSINDFNQAEVTQYVMYQVMGAKAAKIALQNLGGDDAGEVTVSELTTFPEQE